MAILFEVYPFSIFSEHCRSNRCYVNDIVYAGLSAMIAFPVFLGFLQMFFLAPLGISARSSTFFNLMGFLSLMLSSTLTAWINLSVMEMSATWRENRANKQNNFLFNIGKSRAYMNGKDGLHCPIPNYKELLCLDVFGIMIFILFGGKCKSLLPSHLFHPGAFARRGLLVRSKHVYATRKEKSHINKIGKQYGCHSCGQRNISAFVADHQPPSKLIKFGTDQWFYPQCPPCSVQQGNALLHEKNFLLQIQTHVTTLRLYHLWIPLPSIIAFYKLLLEESAKNKPLCSLWSSFTNELYNDLLHMKLGIIMTLFPSNA